MLKHKVYLAKLNNLPKHYGAGPPEERGPMQLHRLHRLRNGPGVWYGLRSSKSESEQWVWCINIETGSTRTQTIPDASEKDVTLRSQTHALKKRTGRVPCAYNFTL